MGDLEDFSGGRAWLSLLKLRVRTPSPRRPAPGRGQQTRMRLAQKSGVFRTRGQVARSLAARRCHGPQDGFKEGFWVTNGEVFQSTEGTGKQAKYHPDLTFRHICLFLFFIFLSYEREASTAYLTGVRGRVGRSEDTETQERRPGFSALASS